MLMLCCVNYFCIYAVCRLLPQSTYVIGDLKSPEFADLRGTKNMTDKSKMTVILCCNATGTIRVPPLFIGKSKRPRVFTKYKDRAEKVGVLHKYTHQENAFNTLVICESWRDKVFLPYVTARLSGKIYLLWDGFKGHPTEACHPRLEIITLPPNLTAKYQPLDQGIIWSLKARYRSTIADKLGDFIEGHEAYTASRDKGPSTGKGLIDGWLPHILDAIEIVDSIWKNNITDGVIKNCFHAANILPPSQQQQLAELCKKNKIPVKPDIDIVMTRFMQLIMTPEQRISSRKLFGETVLFDGPSLSEDELSLKIKDWIMIEESKEVMEKTHDSIVYQLCHPHDQANNKLTEAESDADSDCVCAEEVATPAENFKAAEQWHITDPPIDPTTAHLNNRARNKRSKTIPDLVADIVATLVDEGMPDLTDEFAKSLIAYKRKKSQMPKPPKVQTQSTMFNHFGSS
jgi:hypothetical protein